MLHSHYRPEISWPKIVSGLMLILISGAVIWMKPPNNWVIETGVVLLIGSGLYLIVGKLISIGVIGLLIMRRLAILDGITLGVWIAIIGLISLMN